MPKTVFNSRPCACCHRFIALKRGKQRTCSELCGRVTAGQAAKESKRLRDESRRLKPMPFHAGLR